jgi:hypothetical protein
MLLMESPEVTLNIDSQEIVANPLLRELKAQWSREAAEDLRAWHNIDAEKALAKALADALAQEINAEIDREILQDLRSNAVKGQETEQKLNKKKKVKVTYRSIDADWEPTKKD